jgi:hypothetical protein
MEGTKSKKYVNNKTNMVINKKTKMLQIVFIFIYNVNCVT